MAICDALLDYYLPNQAQRERAHRDLMARDGLTDGGGVGLPVPLTVAPAVSSTVGTAGGRTGGRESGGGGGEGGGRDVNGIGESTGGVQGSEGRDDDDEVSELTEFVLL